jgi:cell wall-associated NlpC family hydrolase
MPHPLVTACRTYLGTPFQHQGRSRRGCDCIGLPVLGCRDCGVQLNDRTDYQSEPDHQRFRQHIYAELGPARASRAEWREGDIAMLRTAKHPHHLAVLVNGTDPGTFKILHADGIKGVVEVSIDARFERTRVAAVFPSPVRSE